MTITKEIDVLHPLYIARLENGVSLEVYGDSANGSDGKTYYHIGKEVDGVLETLGWSCDVDCAVII